MEVYRLDITQTAARLDMQGQNMRLSTSMPPAKLDISSEPAHMEMEARHPQISVDASAAEMEEGHATNAELVAQFADMGRQSAQEAAQQTNAMGQVYRAQLRNKQAIARHALDQAVPAMPTYPLTFVPFTAPQISFSDNMLSYSYQPKTLQLNWQTYQNASISVDRPAQLSVWLSQEPQLHFSVQA